uniref:Uncharacterized protein n=1 Tax=uncultured marine virus TaxID=186617 RepID=A0A0F7L6U1_9VIRU|nr:hypothetical protein [uncultured marine virus]
MRLVFPFRTLILCSPVICRTYSSVIESLHSQIQPPPSTSSICILAAKRSLNLPTSNM